MEKSLRAITDNPCEFIGFLLVWKAGEAIVGLLFKLLSKRWGWLLVGGALAAALVVSKAVEEEAEAGSE